MNTFFIQTNTMSTSPMSTLYFKNTSRKALQQELLSMGSEMGKTPTEVYFWFVTCPKCDAKKEIKTVILAS